MISFITPTLLPIEAATTMGVSVKGSGDAIGKFGTGLKYAIAGTLRLGGTVDIWIGREHFEFVANEARIRGKAFQIVHCNGQPCGFTTELGKHWEPWQLFRELASNALDEGGHWTDQPVGPDSGETVITVGCKPLEDASKYEGVFIGNRTPLIESSNGATIYAGESQHYYYRGIRAGSFGFTAPVTIDVHEGELSEDRLLDSGTMSREVAWAFISATKIDHDLMFQVVSQQDPGHFWARILGEHSFHSSPPSPLVMDYMLQRRKCVVHPAFHRALDAHLRKSGGQYEAIPTGAQHDRLLTEAERVCEMAGVDPIPRDRVRFTRDMPDGELAVTQMDTRTVWFSTKIVMAGRDEFLSGYLEEAMHAMTGLGDCTRQLQNALLLLVVNMASREWRAAA